MTHQHNADKPRFNPWPLGIVALLLTVVVANVTMLIIAQRNPPVMVERPPIPSAAPAEPAPDAAAPAAAPTPESP